MCVISMVYDHYNREFSRQASERDQMAMLEAFRRAKEAALVVDKLTGQPDCLDPEKAKLDGVVADLERKLFESRMLAAYAELEAAVRRREANRTQDALEALDALRKSMKK